MQSCIMFIIFAREENFFI